ncbi:MAG: hypothetical protein N2C12_18835, partial [Planctomycetales bacterium]
MTNDATTDAETPSPTTLNSPSRQPAHNKDLLWLAIVSLVLVVSIFTVYGQVIDHQYVRFDDMGIVKNNPHVNQGITTKGVLFVLRNPFGSNWHPLTWMTHMIDFELWGAHPGRHALTNVGIHAASAVALLLAFYLLSGSLWPSVLVAAIFALHPMRVESVAWISERKDVLAGLFWMLTMLAYAWYVRRPGMLRYALLFLLFGLGLTAKQSLVTLPFALVLLDFWPLGRTRLGYWPSKETTLPGIPVRSLLWIFIEKFPLFALSGGAVLITTHVQKGIISSMEFIPQGERIANALTSYVRYLEFTMKPTNLSCFYPHPSLIDVDKTQILWVPAIYSTLVLAALTTALVGFGRRRPYLIVGWLWYLGTLVPMIGLVQVGRQAFADRYSYISLIGIYVIVAWALKDFVKIWPATKRVVITAVMLVIHCCMVLTWRQVATWTNT